MALPRPTPPGFEPKAKKGKKSREESAPGVPKTRAKVIRAPKEKVAPKLGYRVTAGPFFDKGHPRSYEAWVVITRAGDFVTYHRFRSEDDAKVFAAGFESNP